MNNTIKDNSSVIDITVLNFFSLVYVMKKNINRLYVNSENISH